MAGASNTVTDEEEALFTDTKSSVVEVTVAALATMELTAGTTTMVTVAELPASRFPSVHDTVPTPGVQLPCDDTAETNVTPAGNVSINEMFSALAGPLFVTVTENVRLLPAATGFGMLACATETSANGVTVVI